MSRVLLAHDQTWSADDWWTIALVPPGLWMLSVILIGLIYAFEGRERLVNAVISSAIFIGISCFGAWFIIWAIAGISWLGGWL